MCPEPKRNQLDLNENRYGEKKKKSLYSCLCLSFLVLIISFQENSGWVKCCLPGTSLERQHSACCTEMTKDWRNKPAPTPDKGPSRPVTLFQSYTYKTGHFCF